VKAAVGDIPPSYFRNNKFVAGVRNIDVAPTILSILGVAPSPKVDGMVLKQVLH
jgi:arylsulfatase A-like enzyme